MRLTSLRSGAALQWRRARAPDDLRYRGSDRPGSEPNSAGAEVWNLECPLESKVPRASAGISARRFHFPGFGSRTAREGNDNHGEAEAQAPRDLEDRRQGAAPRPPGSRVRTYALAQPGAALPSLDSEWATRRPVARLPGWLLHRGGTSTWAACAWPLVQQQHTEQRARDFGRRASPLAYVRCADLTLSLATILGNLTDDDRRKIERAPPGTTIPCGEGLIIAVYTLG